MPFTLLLTRLPAHWCIPAIEFGVAAATLGNYAITGTKSLFAVRFLAGFFEGGYFPGVMFIMGSWYTPAELAKRMGLFYASGTLGGMFSGFLQSAAYTNLDGKSGLAGWRWLFIIDFIFTLGVAILGLIFIPDIPSRVASLAKPNFMLSQADIDLANARLARIERVPPTPWSKAKAKRIFSTWQIYLFPILYALYLPGGPQQAMGYWLKSFNAKPAPVPGHRYTVPQINLLPLPASAIAAVTCILFTWISDGPLKGRRWPIIIVCTVGNLAVSLALYLMPLYTNIPGRTVAYYFNSINTAGAMVIYSWAAECTSFDNELRAIVSAASNMLAYTINTILPNFVWKTVDFPAAKKGYRFSIAFSVALLCILPIIMYLSYRDVKIRAARKDEEQSQASTPSQQDEKEADFALGGFTSAPLPRTEFST
ncbi:MFS transporter, ACS family, pantothenate transporter, partial [Phenoliferia sp. Uapishka_3]